MVSQVLWANNALTTLAATITNSQTSISVFSGSGSLFPSPASGQFFAVTLISASNLSTFEVVYCTARSGDTLTVTRGQESTTAKGFNAGDLAQNLLTGPTMELLVQPSEPWTWSATQTFSATAVMNYGLLASEDANGFNLKFYSSTYESGFRNDGAHTYLLLTGSSGGGYNSFFPFFVNNATAAVTIDGTGVGTTFGGPIYPAGGYLTGGVSNPIANTTNGNQVLGNGTEQIYNATMTPLSIGVGFLGQMVDFYYGSSAIGSISYDGTLTHFNQTSDYRAKTIHGAADGTWLSGLPVHDAAFKSAPSVRMPLLLAHEVQSFLPSAVTGSKDATDADGNPVMQQLDMTILVPSVIAYIQSLEKRIAALEAK